MAVGTLEITNYARSALCQKCIDKGEGKDYDYATDDYNYDAARERRAR